MLYTLATQPAGWSPMLRLLLKITFGLFGLITLLMGLRFTFRQTPEATWSPAVTNGVTTSFVTKTGEEVELHTADGKPLYGSVINIEDGWLWLQRPAQWAGVFDLYRVRLNGKHLQPIIRRPMSEEFIGFSGNGQWMIFTGEEYTRDIYRVRTNGSWPHRLVDLPGHDRAIGYAADGDWLLFVNGFYLFDLWRVNTNTGEMQQLTHDLHIEGVELSPDRQWAYIRFKDYDHLDQSGDLARLRVDGTDFQQLTDTRTVYPFIFNQRSVWYLPNKWSSKVPPISPDGRWLLLLAIATPTSAGGYFTMRADGQEVYPLPIEGQLLGWSADSEWIYYKSTAGFELGPYPDRQPGRYYRIRRDGSDPQPLSPMIFEQRGRLSSDGQWIFVEMMDDPTRCYCVKDYYGIATDGSGEWRIAGGMSAVYGDILSPDGAWNYFLISAYDSRYSDLYRMRVGSTQPSEMVARFSLGSYGDVELMDWFEFPAQHWSPLLIFGIAFGAMGAAGILIWKAQVGHR